VQDLSWGGCQDTVDAGGQGAYGGLVLNQNRRGKIRCGPGDGEGRKNYRRGRDGRKDQKILAVVERYNRKRENLKSSK